MQGKGLLLRGRCSIENSHGEQVHVNESLLFIKQRICWISITALLKKNLLYFAFSCCLQAVLMFLSVHTLLNSNYLPYPKLNFINLPVK